MLKHILIHPSPLDAMEIALGCKLKKMKAKSAAAPGDAPLFIRVEVLQAAGAQVHGKANVQYFVAKG